MTKALGIAFSMLLAVAAAWAFTPREDAVAAGEFTFEEIVPTAFGDWQLVPNPFSQVDLAVKRDERDQASLLYDEVLNRSYRNSAGDVVMLAIAWGRQQRQELKIHRPELCYTAQGFLVSGLRPAGADGWGKFTAIDAMQMLAVAPGRIEPVMYWIRVGDEITNNAARTRMEIFRKGLEGQIPDGVLIRTSQIVRGTDQAQSSIDVQKEFVQNMIHAISPGYARHFIGT